MKTERNAFFSALTLVGLLALPRSGGAGQTGQYHGFEAGYCTYYAAKEFDKLAGEPKGSGWRWRGDAGLWLKNAASAGYPTSTDPRKGKKGAIAVWSGGDFGHVAIVTNVTSNSLTISEMNWGLSTGNKEDAKAGRTKNFGKVTTATFKLPNLTRGNTVKYQFKGYVYPKATAGDTNVPTPLLRFQVLGIDGIRYDVHLAAADEVIHRVENSYDGAAEGDRMANGTYYAYVRRRRTAPFVIQSCELFSAGNKGEFNLTPIRMDSYAYVLASGDPTSGDIIVLCQWFSSNGLELRAFQVDRGVLKPIIFKTSSGQEIATELSWTLTRADPLTFITSAYRNDLRSTVTKRWRYDPKQATMSLSNQSRANTDHQPPKPVRSVNVSAVVKLLKSIGDSKSASALLSMLEDIGYTLHRAVYVSTDMHSGLLLQVSGEHELLLYCLAGSQVSRDERALANNRWLRSHNIPYPELVEGRLAWNQGYAPLKDVQRDLLEKLKDSLVVGEVRVNLFGPEERYKSRNRWVEFGRPIVNELIALLGKPAQQGFRWEEGSSPNPGDGWHIQWRNPVRWVFSDDYQEGQFYISARFGGGKG